MTTSTVDTLNSVIPSAIDVPSATELAGAGSYSAVGNYSAADYGVSDPLTSGGSSLPVDTYSPSTSAPTGGSSNPISGGASGSLTPISGSASGSSNPISGSTSGSSNLFSASQGAGSFGGSSQGAGGLQSLGLGTGTTNTFAGTANNPYAGGGGQPFGSLGNVVVGESQWIIGTEITPERFSKAINYTVEELVDSVIGKLSNRIYQSGITISSSGGNPFAGGNNPFGTTNAPALDYLKQAYGTNFPIPKSAESLVTSVYSQTLPSGSATTSGAGAGTSGASAGTSVAGTGTTSGASAGILGASGGNPLVPTNNTAIAPGSIPQQPSVDIVQVLFGQDLKGAGGSTSPSDILRIVQDDLLNFTKTVNSATGKKLFSGNNTPLKSPSDLLTLYKNDIVGANSSINTGTQNAGGDPYNNVFANSGSQAVQPPTDIISTVMSGLMPFSGSDNIFNTPNGGIPIGYGNKDFGGNNAAIGNANWNYGQSNASIGNANWNWDSTKNNTTIGNGNWHLDSSQNNRTIGNGNWYWESTKDNVTLGNGNWDFGNNNTTIGNGNWDFGSNNTIIGNGNHVFTSNSVVIGDGNWSVIIDKSNTAAGDFLGKLDNLVLSVGIKDAADSLVNSLFSKFADALYPLTSDLGESGLKTYNQLFYYGANNT
ncbi:hypothetical protein [Brasilonema bromeliae]|uniref:Uncharacterized protein n=1 Tax=Brasilonema bromeliae SPC951 TaxID=385972 RepID=A0ABX1P8T0_9CYAN|nr:hypothetical protein [Brasilonema bromeliae]NMG19985.1 hypothetical protein [Brasilonema bromeliae SPC951]